MCLPDDDARLIAITQHKRSLLVEAGAGSGKTAVLAARLTALMAAGTAPRSIAAVTFTELAAGELSIRVKDFVDCLLRSEVPPELRTAFPDGLSADQTTQLKAASGQLDELTCATIHGFCLRLIKPYPVEAGLDPGARVMDADQADLAFIDITESWLRERLSDADSGFVAELVLQDPKKTIDLIHTVIKKLRERRNLSTSAIGDLGPPRRAFDAASLAFSAFVSSAAAFEDKTASIARHFETMSKTVDTFLQNDLTTSDLVGLLAAQPHADLCTIEGHFRAMRNKGKWYAAARVAGLTKDDGKQLNAAAEALYKDCCETWLAMRRNVASRVLAGLIGELQPVLQRYREYKRAAALLDFDDLIFAARDLLRHHEDVRHALASRFSRVLVDEFQDTDPVQMEIFWRLCGNPPADNAKDDWAAFRIRPGALFLVGDPKQAIYRFRRADVNAYVHARTLIKAENPEDVVSISTNFRSCAPILDYVNQCFEKPLSRDGQPGFTRLTPVHFHRAKTPCVVALDVGLPDGAEGETAADRLRDAEAKAVASLCARLIGNEVIRDRKTGKDRLCRPGDIALLAPTGTGLYFYEQALERKGFLVASQAGKGLFLRQEIQDLIALTRVLADRRDTLALAAFLRGPVIGLTDEDLLDIIAKLPRSSRGYLPSLDLSVASQAIEHPLARSTIEKLKALSRLKNSTTPHGLLSQAIDVFRVRAILLARHRQAKRAIANVDLYLSFSESFAVRGLRAFAEAMTAAWTDDERAIEGRPDDQDDAIALYTMHAAKGLEWPVVIPINTSTELMPLKSCVFDHESAQLFCPLLGVKPLGYEDVFNRENDEINRERIRLWYVAATRARDLLVLPRPEGGPVNGSWGTLLDLKLGDLPAFDLSHQPENVPPFGSDGENFQTREIFEAQAADITALHHKIVWLAPSRSETPDPPITENEDIEVATLDDERVADDAVPPLIQGGRERGLILHKLFEEVLTGETLDDATTLSSRARILIAAIGAAMADDPARGLAPDELAGCVCRTLALPEIAKLRGSLVPEYPVYASVESGGIEHVSIGIADAVSLDADGKPDVIVDWKSDVKPTLQTIEHYRSQVRRYLDMTGATRGLIVMATDGTLIPVMPSPLASGPAEHQSHE